MKSFELNPPPKVAYNKHNSEPKHRKYMKNSHNKVHNPPDQKKKYSLTFVKIGKIVECFLWKKHVHKSYKVKNSMDYLLIKDNCSFILLITNVCYFCEQHPKVQRCN